LADSGNEGAANQPRTPFKFWTRRSLWLLALS